MSILNKHLHKYTCFSKKTHLNLNGHLFCNNYNSYCTYIPLLLGNADAYNYM